VETVTQVTGMRGISGTLVYMSPQQLSGETPSATDDIYALGATLYELCTTRPPFYSGDVPGQIYNKAVPSMAERRRAFGLPVGEIPEMWEETIAACLSKEASERPQSAGEIAVRLGLATAGTVPAPVRPPTVPVLAPVPPSTPGTSASVVKPAIPPAPATGTAAQFAAPGTAGSFVAPMTAPQGTTSSFQIPPVSKKMWGVIGLGAAALFVAGLFLVGVVTWLLVPKHPKPEVKPIASQNAPATEPAKPAKAPVEPAVVPPVNARGSMVVKTEPANAWVKVDDGTALATPAVISDLKAGSHTVEITREGYNPVQMKVEVKANEPADLGMVSLVRSVGGLKIETDPPGLKFLLKSETDQADNRAGETPLVSANIPTGSYQVTVEREGWKPATKPVTIVRGEEQRMSFEFPLGSVTITSVPSGAKVSVDNHVLGVTPLRLEERPPGEISYTLSASGYEKLDGTVTVEAGQDLTAPAVSLKKSAPVAKNPPPTPKKITVSGEKETPKRTTSSRGSSSGNRDSGSRSSGSNSGSRSSDGPSKAERAAEIMRLIPGGIPFR
jgi:hypothetical protein